MRVTAKALLLSMTILASALAGCLPPPEQNGNTTLRPEFKCADLLDNDNDGLTDCADPDCNLQTCSADNDAIICQAVSGNCVGGERDDLCTNDIDDDGDTFLDCDDPDCSRNCDCFPDLCEERCDNGQDEDGDGLIDEGCPCRFMGSANGVCINGRTDGVESCLAPEGYQQLETACDGLDNDCDGVADVGCNCIYELGGTAGVCLSSTVNAGGDCGPPFGFTSPEPGSNVQCDGLDNDCDGIIDTDECDACDFRGMSTGVCLAGVLMDQDCTQPANFESTETRCDGADNDCDGFIDEECPCRFADRSVGVCVTASRDVMGNCAAPLGYESTEANCDDDLDNDCDGTIDCDDPDCAAAMNCEL